MTFANWLDQLFNWGYVDATRETPNLPLIKLVVFSVHYTSVVGVPALLCWLARRYALGFRWALVGCALCSLHGLFHVLALTDHSLSWRYALSPDWFAVLAPWLILGAFRLWVTSVCSRPAAAGSLEITI